MIVFFVGSIVFFSSRGVVGDFVSIAEEGISPILGPFLLRKSSKVWGIKLVNISHDFITKR